MARRRFLSLDEGSRPRSPERVLSRRGDLQGCAQPLSCPFFPLLPMYIFLPHEGCGVNDIFSSAFRKSYTYIIFYTIRASTIHHLKTANIIYNASTKRPFTSYLYIDKDSVVPNRSTITYYRYLFKYNIPIAGSYTRPTHYTLQSLSATHGSRYTIIKLFML